MVCQCSVDLMLMSLMQSGAAKIADVGLAKLAGGEGQAHRDQVIYRCLRQLMHTTPHQAQSRPWHSGLHQSCVESPRGISAVRLCCARHLAPCPGRHLRSSWGTGGQAMLRMLHTVALHEWQHIRHGA
jgi:hypothetical protein